MPPPSTIRLPGPRLTDFRSLPGLAGFVMDLFTQLFGSLLAFVYHCFDRIVIYGYLSGLSRPERVVNFFHQVVGVPVVSREILSQRTADYQNWVEAFARNHPTARSAVTVRSMNSGSSWTTTMRAGMAPPLIARGSAATSLSRRRPTASLSAMTNR